MNDKNISKNYVLLKVKYVRIKYRLMKIKVDRQNQLMISL